MFKQISSNSILNYIVIGLLLAAVAIRGGASLQWIKPDEKPLYGLDDIKKAFPKAERFKRNADKSLTVTDKDRQILGYALISEDLDARYQGYAGHVPLLVALDANKQIVNVLLLPNSETPGYIRHLQEKKLLDAWNGHAVDTSLLSRQVDAVSGATFSSKAIIRTVHQTAANYLQLKGQERPFSVIRAVELLLMGLLLFLSLGMVLGKRFRKYYWYYLAGVVLVMGVWSAKMLSLGQFHHWLTKGLPWQSHWELLAILLLSVALALAGHRKYYCNYLCPMGAIQMLVSKVSPFKKRSASLKISVVTLRAVYLSFIWASLLLGFALPLADMEPFMAFSFKVASSLMLIAGAFIVVLSLFFNRPWCQLCPTGCLLDTIQPIVHKTNQSTYEK
ncbi:MAG: 4Fe-4S binding protein [Breznakibacter sp.]